MRYDKDGPVIQTSITSVIPIVTLQKCVGYTKEIWVDHPGWVKVPGPLIFIYFIKYKIMVFVIQKLTCYTNGYNFRYIQKYNSYTEDILAILLVCLNIFYRPPGPRPGPPPPTRKLYIDL